MKRISWLLVVPLVLAGIISAPAACVEFDTYQTAQHAGGTGGMGGSTSSTGGMGGSTSSTGGMGGGGSGGMTPCAVAADCDNGECRTDGSCVNGLCEWKLVDNGVVLASQLYGDCSNRVCDGKGYVAPLAADPGKDLYVWENPCYLDACGAWENPMPADGVTCTTDWGKTGTCSNLKCVECVDASTCNGGKCVDDKCVPATCDDLAQNGDETDVDCGGSCLPCAAMLKCKVDADCIGHGKCDVGGTNLCMAATCGDGIKNGDETDVDCGGSAACVKEFPTKKACIADANCLFPDDCESGVCKIGKCAAPACDDATLNGEETGIDCGGNFCAPCTL